MRADEYIFSGHAVLRIYQRRITDDEVIKVIEHGEVIEDYPEDYPYPS
jgi:uncharacterized protein (DUF433 family)